MARKRFTELFPEDLTYDKKSRIQKAKKIVAVLKDYHRQNAKRLSDSSCLDLGCSVGIITRHLGKYFKKVVGVDVDEQAIRMAKKQTGSKNVNYKISKEKELPFSNDTFDVVIFNQIYEHVEEPKALISEVKRVLKPGGICFFGARNRFGGPLDGHYSLPFLAWLPRSLSDKYIKFFTDKKHYDIVLYPVWQLKRLVKDFTIHDYTLKIINNPEKFSSKDIIPIKFGINKVIYLTSFLLYSFIPNYIWLLEK